MKKFDNADFKSIGKALIDAGQYHLADQLNQSCRIALNKTLESVKAYDMVYDEKEKLKTENAVLRAKVAARDELIEKLSRSVDACIEQGASTLRRVADYGKRWTLDAAYGTQEIASVTIDKVIPEYEAPPNGWQTFNNYLHKAREHGKHDYQKGRTCNPIQYCKPELQDAYKSGYESEH